MDVCAHMSAYMQALMYFCCGLTSSRAWSKLPFGSSYATQQDNTGCSQGHQLDREEPQESPGLPKTTARLSHLSSPLEPQIPSWLDFSFQSALLTESSRLLL